MLGGREEGDGGEEAEKHGRVMYEEVRMYIRRHIVRDIHVQHNCRRC